MARGSNIFAQMRANVRTTRRALARDRMRDYRVARDVNEAIFQNLAGFQARVGRRLTRQNERLLARMGRVARRGQALSRDLRAELAQGAVGMMSDATGAAFAPARVALKGGQQVTQAQLKLGRGIARTGNLALQLAQAGAAEAEAGAEAALAEALQARTQEDVRLVAQMKHDVLMAKLQHQLALEQMEKEFELAKKRMLFEQKLATGQLGGEGKVVTSMAEDLARVSIDMRNYLMKNPDASVAEVLSHLTETGVLTEAEAQHPAYARLADILIKSNIGRGPGTAEPTLDAILNVIRHFWPNYSKYKRLRNLAEQTLRYYASLSALSADRAANPKPELEQATLVRAGRGGPVGILPPHAAS